MIKFELFTGNSNGTRIFMEFNLWSLTNFCLKRRVVQAVDWDVFTNILIKKIAFLTELLKHFNNSSQTLLKIILKRAKNFILANNRKAPKLEGHASFKTTYISYMIIFLFTHLAAKKKKRKKKANHVGSVVCLCKSLCLLHNLPHHMVLQSTNPTQKLTPFTTDVPNSR